jgi:hypothetical protein
MFRAAHHLKYGSARSPGVYVCPALSSSGPSNSSRLLKGERSDCFAQQACARAARLIVAEACARRNSQRRLCSTCDCLSTVQSLSRAIHGVKGKLASLVACGDPCAVDFLAKPFDDKELLEAVREAITRGGRARRSATARREVAGS